MISSIGLFISSIPNFVVAFLIFLCILLLILVNFQNYWKTFFSKFFEKIKKTQQKNKKRLQPRTAREVEELSNSIVGKFLTKDFVDKNEVIAKKGTLISEHIAFEAEKRGLLEKLSKITVYWPVN